MGSSDQRKKKKMREGIERRERGDRALASPGGLLARGWAGWPGWRLRLCLFFFELERRENIEKYILFLYRTYIYQNSQGN